MNIWHDISPKRITADKFYAVIEISKGGKNKYELDKETGMLKLDRVLLHQPTIRLTTALFREPMQMTATRLMYSFFALKQFSL